MDDITLSNASHTPSIAIMNQGVDIAPTAVRITAYYGGLYNYYSMNSQQRYDARTLAKNEKKQRLSTKNLGGSVMNYWNAVTIVKGKNFKAENIIFENSFNQYISHKEATDSVIPQTTKPQRH